MYLNIGALAHASSVVSFRRVIVRFFSPVAQSSFQASVMTTPIPDEMILILYRQILMPWETLLKNNNEKWDAEPLRALAAKFELAIENIEQEHVSSTVEQIRSNGPQDFLVYVRGKSLGRDLFRHVRNAVAHAGISIHKRPRKPTLLEFKSPAFRGSGLALVGQIRAERLSPLIDALVASAPASFV